MFTGALVQQLINNFDKCIILRNVCIKLIYYDLYNQRGTTMGAGGTLFCIGEQSHPPSLLWETVKCLGTQVSSLDSLSLKSFLCFSSTAFFASFAFSQFLFRMAWLTSLHTRPDSLGHISCCKRKTQLLLVRYIYTVTIANVDE